MRIYAETFGRGFALVSLTAANVGQIAAHRYGGAFVCGFLISWLWWRNARGAAHDDVAGVRECYALGAACGTAFGIWLVSAVYAP